MLFIKAMVTEANDLDQAEAKFAAGDVTHSQTHIVEHNITERRCDNAMAVTAMGLKQKLFPKKGK